MALIKCRECGERTSTKAKICQSCGATVKRPISMLRFIGYTLLLFALIAVLAQLAERRESSITPQQRADRDEKRMAAEAESAAKRAAQREKACSAEIPAYVMAQSFVEKRLKAPSTAKFPLITADGVKTQYLGECIHNIVGYVDAQNGFGAVLRTRYQVKLKNNPVDDTWVAVEVKMDR